MNELTKVKPGENEKTPVSGLFWNQNFVSSEFQSLLFNFGANGYFQRLCCEQIISEPNKEEECESKFLAERNSEHQKESCCLDTSGCDCCESEQHEKPRCLARSKDQKKENCCGDSSSAGGNSQCDKSEVNCFANKNEPKKESCCGDSSSACGNNQCEKSEVNCCGNKNEPKKESCCGDSSSACGNNQCEKSEVNCCGNKNEPKKESCCGDSSSACGNNQCEKSEGNCCGNKNEQKKESCCGDSSSACGNNQCNKHEQKKESCCGDSSSACGNNQCEKSEGNCCGNKNEQKKESCCGDSLSASRECPPKPNPVCKTPVLTKSALQATSAPVVAQKSASIQSTDTLSLTIASAPVVETNLLCSLCDPASALMHTIQATRLRVANLCCIKEEQLIRKTLEESAFMKGIESISINLIGKYAIIKHCNTDCCAPSTKMVELLNTKHLGVSIQDIHDHNGADSKEGSSSFLAYLFGDLPVPQVLHCLLISCMFIIGLVLSLIPHNQHYLLISNWIFIVASIIGALPILRDGFIAVFYQYTIDIHILMLIAIIGSLVGSEYFDSSLVVALFNNANLLEKYIMLRVQKAISLSSSSTIPKSTFSVTKNKTIPVEELEINEVIAVRTGEMVLSDGKVVKGEGVIDESALTGESQPITKKKNDVVHGGTILQNGYLEIQILKNPKESLIYKLYQTIEEVSADRGRYANLVDQFALYWTPLVILITLSLVLIGGGVSDEWWDYFQRGLVLLILACPCAIVISAPIPSVSAIANSSKHGVLIKGSTIIEKLSTIDTVTVDKTGTLTKGFFKIHEKVLVSDDDLGSGSNDVQSKNDLIDEYMFYVASLEQRSTHPLSYAIISDFCGCVSEMDEKIGTLSEIKKLVIKEGVGIEGWVKDRENKFEWKYVVIGNEKLLKAHGGSYRPSSQQTKMIESFTEKAGKDKMILFIVIDDELKLLLSLSDELRDQSKSFVQYLTKNLSFDCFMLTGDHEVIAKSICQEIAIPESHCFSRLLPHEKLEFVKYYQAIDEELIASVDLKSTYAAVPQDSSKTLGTVKNDIENQLDEDENDTLSHRFQKQNEKMRRNRKILMIGDGINDSTALAASTVGVAMGANGTAMAVSAADVVLMTENLLLVPYAIEISRYACSTIFENVTFAVVVKIVAVILAIAGMLNLWQAIIIDIGSLIIVVINGMKVLSYKSKVSLEVN